MENRKRWKPHTRVNAGCQLPPSEDRFFSLRPSDFARASPVFPPAGQIAFASQSGALGLAILEQAQQLNLGLSAFVSLGNKADVSANDLLEHWEHDPRTRVILLYLESFGNPRRFRGESRPIDVRCPSRVVSYGRTRGQRDPGGRALPRQRRHSHRDA